MYLKSSDLVREFEAAETTIRREKLLSLKGDPAFLDHVWRSTGQALTQLHGSEDVARAQLHNVDISRIAATLADGGPAMKWVMPMATRLMPEQQSVLSKIKFSVTTSQTFNCHFLAYAELMAIIVSWNVIVSTYELNQFYGRLIDNDFCQRRTEIMNGLLNHTSAMTNHGMGFPVQLSPPPTRDELVTALRISYVQILFLLMHEIGHAVQYWRHYSGSISDAQLADMRRALPFPATTDHANEWFADAQASMCICRLSDGFALNGTVFSGEAARNLVMRSLCYLFASLHFSEKFAVRSECDTHPPAAHRLLGILNTYRKMPGWKSATNFGFEIYDIIKDAYDGWATTRMHREPGR